jgi:hypothetical protein
VCVPFYFASALERVGFRVLHASTSLANSSLPSRRRAAQTHKWAHNQAIKEPIKKSMRPNFKGLLKTARHILIAANSLDPQTEINTAPRARGCIAGSVTFSNLSLHYRADKAHGERNK